MVVSSSTPKKCAAFKVSNPNSTAEVQWVWRQSFSLHALAILGEEKENFPPYRNWSNNLNTSKPTMPTGMICGVPGLGCVSLCSWASPQNIIRKKGLRAASTHLWAYTCWPSTSNVTSLKNRPFVRRPSKSVERDLIEESSEAIELSWDVCILCWLAGNLSRLPYCIFLSWERFQGRKEIKNLGKQKSVVTNTSRCRKSFLQNSFLVVRSEEQDYSVRAASQSSPEAIISNP